ncbi:hypothetical protein ILUMI_10593 [Ignelater luminosus]|uniref:Reverse transcriptase domain-containing protein n=1 Tax=Ignelater luminosus TaxID=2038154 RepID=A0A8K0CXK4_IGNLU|nr:hypothetical protein ILUMI_10593 [Ignelater luminosus]
MNEIPGTQECEPFTQNSEASTGCRIVTTALIHNPEITSQPTGIPSPTYSLTQTPSEYEAELQEAVLAGLLCHPTSLNLPPTTTKSNENDPDAIISVHEPDNSASTTRLSRPTSQIAQPVSINTNSNTSDLHLRNDALTIFHPTPPQLQCPIPNCGTFYKSTTWTSMKQSVIRHLKQTHDIKINEYENICRRCRLNLGNRPSKHECQDKNNLIPPLSQRTFLWQCTTCPMTFPSKKALANHQLAKEKSEVLSSKNDTLPKPNTRRSKRRKRPSASSSENDDVSDSSSSPRDVLSVIIEDASRSPNPNTGETSQHHDDAPSPSPSPFFGTRSPAAFPSEAASLVSSQSSVNPSTQDTEYLLTSSEPIDNPSQHDDVHDIPSPTGDRPPSPSSSLDDYSEALNQILNSATSDASWTLFLDTLSDVTKKVQHKYKIRLDAPTHSNNPQLPTDKATDARYLQTIYRNNRRRAVRLIRGERNTICSLETNAVFDHFTNKWATTTNSRPIDWNPPTAPPPLNVEPFDQNEVRSRLKRFENSAPGEDRLTYRHWRLSDPDCRILTIILNICLKYRKIPDTWKSSTTILIPKKGDLTNLNNWRPISLNNTIYKLYAGCLQTRLSAWLAGNQVLHPNQKGFLPFDGVLEHNYILQTTIDHAKRGQRDVHIGWLDISNAFNNVPHDALTSTLASCGAGEAFTEIVADMLRDNKTRIRTASGYTDAININNGVKQGCPLSGLLFNIAINPILDTLQARNDDTHKVLGYADDLVLIHDTNADLQNAITTLERLLSDIHLRLNPDKCKSLSIVSKHMTNPTFSVNNKTITSLDNKFDTETFLGKPVGFCPLKSTAGMKEFIKLGTDILQSKLAPWQRIDALKTFAYPAYLFAMRTNQFPKTAWKRLDDVFRAELKKTLSFPQEAANEYLYGPRKQNLVGVPLAAELSDVAIIDTAFKLLTSPDAVVSQTANDDLMRTVEKRGGAAPASPEAAGEYLTGSMEGRFANSRNEQSNIWTTARMSSRRQDVEWSFEDSRPSLLVGAQTIDPAKRRPVCATLRAAAECKRAEHLKTLKNQGKTFKCFSADWRFIHKARLNLVPLRANQRWQNGDKTCRRCRQQDETLPPRAATLHGQLGGHAEQTQRHRQPAQGCSRS